jgi:hypothetical protein
VNHRELIAHGPGAAGDQFPEQGPAVLIVSYLLYEKGGLLRNGGMFRNGLHSLGHAA